MSELRKYDDDGGSLVWLVPAVTGGRVKGKVIRTKFDEVLREWRYLVRVTGSGSAVWSKGTEEWVPGGMIEDRWVLA